MRLWKIDLEVKMRFLNLEFFDQVICLFDFEVVEIIWNIYLMNLKFLMRFESSYAIFG